MFYQLGGLVKKTYQHKIKLAISIKGLTYFKQLKINMLLQSYFELKIKKDCNSLIKKGFNFIKTF